MGSVRSAPPLQARAGYFLHPGTLGLRTEVSPLASSVEVRRLSLHDGELVVDEGEPSPFHRGADFELHMVGEGWGAPELVLRARCRGTRSEGRRNIVDFDLSPSRQDARQLYEVLEGLKESNQAHSDWRTGSPLQEIAEPRERIAELLEAMVLLHREMRVHAGDGSHIPSSDLREKSRWPRFAFTVDVRAPRADYVFHVGERPEDGAPRTMRLLRTALRSDSRVAAPSRTRLTVEHRLFSGPVSMQVEAISRRTLVVAKDPELLLYPGMALPGARVRWQGGELELDLVVGEAIRDPVHGRCQELRVRLESSDHEAWKSEVDRLCHPHAHLHPGDPDDLWNLYARSGYLSISDKEPEHFEHLRSSFITAADTIHANPELGAQVTWRAMEGLDGSVTFLNAWEHSALIYQLARASERPLWMSGSRPLYDLYLRATEHVLRHGTEWLVVFVQHAGARFSKRVNRDFPAAHDDGRRSHVSPFRAWEVPTFGAKGQPISARVACREPTPDELRVWLADLGLRRPYAYLAGYDLVPRRAMLREPAARFEQAGATRARTFRLARVDGSPVAMAWIESIADGFHLFGLLDSIRIDPFVPLDRATETLVRQALVREAQIHLGKLGKRRLTFFDEQMGPAPVDGAVNLGDADQALFSTELCPELIEEVAIDVGRTGH